MYVHQMDVISYVQGDLTDEIYMIQPEMFVKHDAENKVCKLNEPLYGLKQAGREWYLKLSNPLESIGFKKSPVNPCVYTYLDIIIIIYVDDLLIGSTDIQKLNGVKTTLQRKFKMYDLGEIKDILNIQIDRVGETGEIKLTQKRYIKDLLQKFDMENCNASNTPLNPDIRLTKLGQTETIEEMKKMSTKPYRELVGSLIYLANATCPDIAFATSTLSRFCEKPHLIHWKMAKHVLRYLQGTIDYSIKYTNECNLVGYVDSDWAGDIEDRRSCSGYVVTLGNGPITWSSKKQKSVALSTMEAEYTALSEATKEVIYLRDLLKHMNFEYFLKDATTVYCDNQSSAIVLSKNNVNHSRSKHIDIRYHFSREAQERGDVKVTYLNTNEMVADMLTKPLPKIRHAKCVGLLRLEM